MYNRYEFSSTPTVEKHLNNFERTHGVSTTMRIGKLTPIDYEMVMPGETLKVNLQGQIRLITSKYPTMDRSYLDMYAFFVPMRLCYKYWKNFVAQENIEDPFVKVEYTLPEIKTPADTNKWDMGSVADYFGLPTEQATNKPITRFLFNSFAKIWNEWFRSQQLQKPIDIPNDDVASINGKHIDESTNEKYITNTAYGGNLPPVCKLHDYFTSALPSPQFGEAVSFNLTQDIPISTGAKEVPQQTNGIIVKNVEGNPVQGKTLGTDFSGYLNSLNIGATKQEGNIYFSNLWAKAKDTAAISLMDFRKAVMDQHYAEKRLIYGGRLDNWIKGMYGVESNLNELDITELISAKRTNIQMQQVVQTSATTGTGADIQALGEVSGMSNTQSPNLLSFDKSFKEHGVVIICACVRYPHTYSQGIDKRLTKFKLEDFYNDIYANKSEQPVMKSELYADMKDDEVFGYQEPWAEERYRQNVVSGLMRPNVKNSVGKYWNYADEYKARPTLGNDYIQENKENMERTFAIDESELGNIHPFKLDIRVNEYDTKGVPIYGVPGVDRI